METITYGIIGAGRHALRSHALPAKELGRMELVAVCDVSEDALADFSEQYGTQLETYTDREQFLQSAIGAVVVATPDEYHFDDMQTALSANKHVFVEKPVAVTETETDQLRQVLDQANQDNLVVSSCHARRFDPPFMWLKDQLPAYTERFGEPVELHFDFSYAKPAAAWKQDRGLLLDHANHEIDLTNYLFGASGFEAHRLSDSYDQYRVAGIRDDGISFGFTGTRRLDTSKYLEQVSIRFEQGEVSVNTDDGVATISDHNSSIIEAIEVGPTDYVQRGLATMANFRDSILGVAGPYLTTEDIYVNTATSVMLTNHKTWRYENGDS